MNKKLLGSLVGIACIAVTTLFYLTSSQDRILEINQARVAGNRIKEEKNATDSSQYLNEAGELEFTQEELEGYYKVYVNPYVMHIRKALNGYLDGTNEGIEFPDVVIDAHELEGTPAGLDSFSKDYYRSKFVVMAINDGPMGGKIINIVFQDKPDKLFNVWVYQLADGTYDFRGFWQNTKFTEEKMKKTQKMFEKYINDTEHAL